MFWFLFVLSALAAPPSGAPHAFSLGSSAVAHVQVFEDHVVSVDGGSAYVVSFDDWSVYEASDCEVTAATLVDSGDVQFLWVGCETGQLYLHFFQDGAWFGGDLETDDLGEGAVRALFASTSYMYAIFEPDDGANLQFFPIDKDIGEANSAVQTNFPDYTDALLGANRIIVAHDSYKMSTFNLSGALGNYTTSAVSLEASDLAPDLLDGAYVLDAGEGTIWQYFPDVTVGTQVSVVATGLNEAQAIGVSTETDEQWMLLGFDGGVDAFDLSTGTLDTSSVLETISSEWSFKQLVAGTKGYHFGGTDSGDLVVLTSKPWVSDVQLTYEIETSEVEDEDTDTDEEEDTGEDTDTIVETVIEEYLTVQFSTDSSGDYEIVVGGTWEGGGQSLSSGTVDAAGTHSVELAIDTSDGIWDDGSNSVYVFFTADSEVGHGKATLDLESAPGQVSLDSSNLGFDDGALILTFTGLDDTDLDYYAVYVTTEEFNADDYATGGPEFDGSDELETPVFIQDPEAGATITQRITPLTNDVTYYVAVRAMDLSGLEGPMSDVLSERPRLTYNATGLSADPGGFQCSGVGVSTALGLLGTLGVFAMFARRRSSMLGLCLALGVSVLLVSDAEAGSKRSKIDRGDLTPQWGQLEVRYGPVWLEDERITQIYSGSYDDANGHNHFGQALQIEVGPQLFRFFEMDLGVGWLKKSGFSQDDEGTESAQATVFSWVPLSISFTGRVHIWDEQLIVPYISYGRDWVIWNEKVDEGDGNFEGVGGVKFGWHWAAGISVLLDVFDFRRASLLEATTGINDTYLTFEYREQVIEKGSAVTEGEDQLSFSGRLFTVGLKLDF